MQQVRTMDKDMSEPVDPTKACPTCGQWGHWKVDCPQRCPDTPGEIPTSQTWRVECPQGRPGAPGEIPTSPPNPSPTLRVIPTTGPGFQPLGQCPGHKLGTWGRQGSGRKKDLLYSRHWSCFLSLNFLLWPNSRLRTHNQGGLWSSLKAKNQPSITLSIWKIDSHTLIPHNA